MVNMTVFKFGAFLLACLLLSPPESNAQKFLKKLTKQTTDKIGDHAEKVALDKISTGLANMATRPLDDAFDSMFKASYEDKYGKPYSDTLYDNDRDRQQAMSRWISTMYNDVDLPEEYRFDHTIEVEVYDFDNKKADKLKLMVSEKGQSLGILSEENKQKQAMVFDYINDLVAIFNLKEKTVMAIANVSLMVQSFGNSVQVKSSTGHMRVRKLNDNKKILGYSAEGFTGENEEHESKFYVHTAISFIWYSLHFSGCLIVWRVSPVIQCSAQEAHQSPIVKLDNCGYFIPGNW